MDYLKYIISAFSLCLLLGCDGHSVSQNDTNPKLSSKKHSITLTGNTPKIETKTLMVITNEAQTVELSESETLELKADELSTTLDCISEITAGELQNTATIDQYLVNFFQLTYRSELHSQKNETIEGKTLDLDKHFSNIEGVEQIYVSCSTRVAEDTYDEESKELLYTQFLKEGSSESGTLDYIPRGGGGPRDDAYDCYDPRADQYFRPLEPCYQ